MTRTVRTFLNLRKDFLESTVTAAEEEWEGSLHDVGAATPEEDTGSPGCDGFATANDYTHADDLTSERFVDFGDMH